MAWKGRKKNKKMDYQASLQINKPVHQVYQMLREGKMVKQIAGHWSKCPGIRFTPLIDFHPVQNQVFVLPRVT